MSELVLEKNNELPLGWIDTNVKTIAEIIMGQAPSGDSYNQEKKGTVFVKVGEFGQLYPKETVWTTKPLSFSKKKDVLICVVGATIGKINLGIDCAIGRSVSAIRPQQIILNSKFLYYYLSTLTIKIRKNQQGSAQGVIGRTYLENLEILLPPINEQKRIVAKIEELFSLVEFVKQTLEKTELRLTLYQRTLLKKIFDKITSQIPLSTIAHINPTPEKDRFSDDLTVSFLPMRNVEEMTGKIDTSLTKKFKEVKKGYTFFEEGDLLFAKITPCMENGKVAIAQGLTNKIGFGSTEFHVIRFKNDDMLSKFYFWYLIQDEFRNLAQQNMKGTAGQLRVPTDYLKNILVPHPSKKEQNKIIIDIEENITKIRAQQALVNTSLKKINSLKQTILKQAFEGKLVPQDPNDEPAEILLEKIKQEKQKIISQTKRGKKNDK